MWYPLLTVVGCAALLAADAVPGFFSSVLLCPCVTWFALSLAGIAWLLAGVTTLSDGVATWKDRRRVYAAYAVALAAAGMILTHVPSRVALWVVRDHFEALFAAAPNGFGGQPKAPPQWVGGFYVDEYCADGQGGYYFRTSSHADGIGPDTMSYGFAYRPDRNNCPFGSSCYRANHLFGDWYWFSVSND